jgi:Ca2+-binding RTX toxin-like protein
VAYGGKGSDAVSGGDGGERLHGGSDADSVAGGNGDDRISGNKGDDAVSGGDGSDSLFGGWGADRVSGGNGADRLHALAPDGQVDVLNCGDGADEAFVLRAERPLTRLYGCEKLYVVVELTPDQSEGETAEADAEAEG